MIKKEEEKGKPTCENCGVSFGYVKIKENEWQCRRCGHLTGMEEEEEDG